MTTETQDILYRRRCENYHGWGGVFTGDYEPCPKCNGTGWQEWAAGVIGNCTECHGFGIVGIEHSPADGLVEVAGDALPDEVAAILALTPQAAEETPWAEREALAAAVSEAGAAGLAESWGWCWADKPINMDANGDVWA